MRLRLKQNKQTVLSNIISINENEELRKCKLQTEKEVEK